MAMIEIRRMRKAFGSHVVLEDVDLDIERGETHIILGRSGTGKSVLLKIICGLIEPDGGRLVVDGDVKGEVDKKQWRAAMANVQMLFQGAALFDSMTIEQNVAFHAIEHGEIKRSQASAYAREFLEMVDLADAGGKMPAELSGGMKKRAALARALAARPRIMLYDEPTTGLDPLTCQVINNLIRQTQERLHVTSIVVTHDLRSAQEVGDRCSFLHEGRILETTRPRDLARSEHEIVRTFLEDAVVFT